METKELLSSSSPQHPSHTRPRRRSALSRKLWILIAVLLIFLIALAVGLGVGLTRNANANSKHSSSSSNSSSDAGSSSNSTSSGADNPSGNLTATSISNQSTPYSSSTASTNMGVTPSKDGIWQPPANASWQIVLLNPLQLDLTSATLSPNVDVWDIDMFTNSKDTIDHLHQLGKRVVCYFSAGSYEPNRPDSSRFTSSDMGGELNGWPGEHWLKLSSSNVRNIMADRIATAYSKGCDAIDPDNVDGYGNTENGLGLTQQDSIDYIGFLSETAAKYNISVGLKNAGAIIPQVLDKVHFSVNEQCVQYSECASYAPFIAAQKPVFHIEYPKGDTTNNNAAVDSSKQDSYCNKMGKASGSTDFSTTIKNMNLDGWVQYCNGAQAVTPCSSSAGKGSYGSSDSD